MTTNILDHAESVLRQDGYSTRRTSLEHSGSARSVILFEDACLLGVVISFDTANSLHATWQDMQNVFVRTHATHLRRDQAKAWSIYFILLTSEELSTTKQFAINAIEEDLQISRKIARSGVKTRLDVSRALAPIRAISPHAALSGAHSQDAVGAKLSEDDNQILSFLREGKAESVVTWIDSAGIL